MVSDQGLHWASSNSYFKELKCLHTCSYTEQWARTCIYPTLNMYNCNCKSGIYPTFAVAVIHIYIILNTKPVTPVLPGSFQNLLSVSLSVTPEWFCCHSHFSITLILCITKLMLSMLVKKFSRQFEIFFLIFLKNRFWHFMQIKKTVCMKYLILISGKKYDQFAPAKFAHRVAKVIQDYRSKSLQSEAYLLTLPMCISYNIYN